MENGIQSLKRAKRNNGSLSGSYHFKCLHKSIYCRRIIYLLINYSHPWHRWMYSFICIKCAGSFKTTELLFLFILYYLLQFIPLFQPTFSVLYLFNSPLDLIDFTPSISIPYRLYNVYHLWCVFIEQCRKCIAWINEHHHH